jgi:hypothetical protein
MFRQSHRPPEAECIATTHQRFRGSPLSHSDRGGAWQRQTKQRSQPARSKWPNAWCPPPNTLPENFGASRRTVKNPRHYGAPAPCVAARVLMNKF